MSGIGSFVEGFLQGREVRNRWDDRKRRQALEDEQLEWAREDRDWSKQTRNEDRDWNREDRSYVRDRRRRETEELDRLTAEEAREREAWEATADQWFGVRSGREAPAPAPNAPAVALGRGQPQAANASLTPLSFGSKGRAAAIAPPRDLGVLGFGTDAPPAATERQPPAEQRRIIDGGERPPIDLPYQDTGGRAAQMAAEGMDRSQAAAARGPRRPRDVGPADLNDRLASAIDGYQRDMAATIDGAPHRVPGAEPAPPVERAPQGDAASVRAEGIAGAVRNIPGAVAGALSGGMRDFAAAGTPFAAGAQEAAGVAASVAQAPDTGAALLRGAERSREAGREYAEQSRQAAPAEPRSAPAAAPPARTGDRTPVQPATLSFGSNVPKTEGGTPMESLDVARRAGIGASGPAQVYSPQQQGRAIEAGMRMYRTEKVPAIYEHYVRTGQLDKAQAFQNFVQDQRTQEGMRGWMKALHGMSANDPNALLDGLAEAYNKYYDDGVSVVRDKSDVRTDSRGNIVGAELTFRDEATGEIFSHTINNERDLAAIGIGMLSPEQAFEKMWDMTFGQKALPANAQPHAQVMAVMKTLSESNLAFSQLPIEEQQRIAAEFIANGGQPLGAGADLPLLP